MQILIQKDYETLSAYAAGKIVSFVKHKPAATLCFASGDTPIGTYRRLAQQQNEGNVDFSGCTFIGLDEWVGMDQHDEGSCGFFVYRDLFGPLGIKPENIHAFDAKANDLPAECHRIDGIIRNLGGIDLLLVGMGVNGHIALNEPGTPFDLYSHVASLHESTVASAQKYFSTPTALTQGITLGLRHLLESKEVLLLASGQRKAAAIRKALEGGLTEQLPASIIRQHTNALVLLDEAAASELTL